MRARQHLSGQIMSANQHRFSSPSSSAKSKQSFNHFRAVLRASSEGLVKLLGSSMVQKRPRQIPSFQIPPKSIFARGILVETQELQALLRSLSLATWVENITVMRGLGPRICRSIFESSERGFARVPGSGPEGLTTESTRTCYCERRCRVSDLLPERTRGECKEMH